MTSVDARLRSTPERFVVAIAGGALAWWFARIATAWWAALPCAALAIVVLSGRRWAAWLAWGTVTLGLVLLAMPNLLSPRPEVVVASIVLVVLYGTLTAVTIALVTSPTFPRHTITLIVWLSVVSALVGRGSPWWTLAALAIIAAAGLLASRRDLPAPARIRRLLPLLTCLVLVVVVAGVLPVSRSPIQGALTTFIQHALFPDEKPLPLAQQPDGKSDAPASSITSIRYTAPMLQLWMRLLERTLVRWAFPLILGLLTLVIGIVVLLFLTRSQSSRVLRLLVLPVTIFGAAVAVVLLTSTLQLPRGQALVQLQGQLDQIRSLPRAQQATATAEALHEVLRSAPDSLQITGIVLASVAVLAIIATTVIILSRAAFDARYGFLHSIADVNERKRVAASIRRIASLDDSLLTSDPRGAVIALFYMGVAAVQDLGLTISRGETPEELVMRCRRHSEPAAAELELLAASFYVARYSLRDVTPEQAIGCRNTYRQLLDTIKSGAEPEGSRHSQASTTR